MERRPVYHCLNLRKDNLVIPDILCQAYVDVIHKRFQLTPLLFGQSFWLAVQGMFSGYRVPQSRDIAPIVTFQIDRGLKMWH
ncbi:hypothetical protein EG499_RS21895 [Escherichia coli]|nr:hypothetical protein [Escherichia coli]